MASLPRKKWTVLVYMGADDDHDAELVTSAFRDLEEMRTVKSSSSLNIAVQLDLRLFKPVRFLVDQSGLLDTKSTGLGVLRETSTGRPTTLQKFLRWALAHAPADRYMLILWGHGLGAGYEVKEATPESRADVVFDADDGLEVRELARVLRQFQQDRGSAIDVLGFDACYMSSVEIAHEYSGLAQCIVGSQIVIPMEGWPYMPILRLLRQRPGLGTRRVAEGVVQSFVKSYPNDRPVTQTAVQPSASSPVVTAMTALVAALEQATAEGPEIRAIRRAFKAAKFIDARQFVDLADLCRCLTAMSRSGKVKAAARAAAAALRQSNAAFVLRHKRKGPGAKGLNGVSAYVRWLKAKTDGVQYDVKLVLKDYRKLDFVKKTKWQEFHDRLPRLQA